MVEQAYRTTKLPAAVRQHAEDLVELHRATGSRQKRMVLDGPKSLVGALVQLAGNILNGNLRLNQKEKRKLKAYAEQIRQFVFGKRNVRDRKALLVANTNQRGGFLTGLITPLLGVFARIVSGFL